jgi:[ribosomal protein S5]-alanine N-acetyltransferase
MRRRRVPRCPPITPQLETARLILRPLELADAEQTQILFPHWEIVQHLAAVVPWPFPPDGAYTHYRDKALPAMARGEAWHWTLRLKAKPGQIIGAIDLRLHGESNRGFWLGLPWHGQGLMTEAARATTAFWFDELGMPELRVSKAVANTASRRISISGGMKLVELTERNFVRGTLPTELWSLTAEDYRAQRAQSST